MPKLAARLNALEAKLDALMAFAEPMSIGEFDGLVAALMVCPELVPPSEWLPLVWGDDDENPVIFDSEGELQSLIGELMQHYNAVSDTLRRRPERYSPVFDVDEVSEETFWETWICGFEAGMALRPAAWNELIEAEGETEASASLNILVALHLIDQGESDIDPEKIEEFVAVADVLIPGCVVTLHEWRSERQGVAPQAILREATLKAGRNDPCPCGSGKKFKKCCGAA